MLQKIYPRSKDRETIYLKNVISNPKFCSIACGAKFIFNSANHSLSSLSTYPFPIFFEEWNLDVKDIKNAWDNKGDIVIGNDVWIGYEAVILAGVPAKPIRKRFTQETIDCLLRIKWWN